jgi:nucleotide-binding universal stress UspA family protein
MADQEQLPIVVGVEGHETGRRALDWALREAQIRGCPVHVVHAWTFDPMADYFTETSSQQVHQESLAMLRREVEQAIKGMPAASADVPSIIHNSVEGDPTRVLPELARGAAMLVVGRHRGGLVQQALLGSVSAVCVRQATCPVVVIPTVVQHTSPVVSPSESQARSAYHE